MNFNMKYEISVLNIHENSGQWVATFKYWIKGECACTAERKTVTFDYKPYNDDLLNSIK